MAANISEGFDRYHYKENIRFCYIVRGSLLETKTWLDKARRRALVDDLLAQQLERNIHTLGVKLTNHLKTLGQKAGSSAVGLQASESVTIYETSQSGSNWETMNDGEAYDHQ